MKPNKEQLRARAWAIAESHFYSDDECQVAWEPFEYWDEEELNEQVKMLAEVIFTNLVWAQEDALT
jgi:hypothetical protein